jgi:hypothetical protein
MGIGFVQLDENEEYEEYNASYEVSGIHFVNTQEIDQDTGDSIGYWMDITPDSISMTDPTGSQHSLGINEDGDMAIDGDKILTTADNISGGSSYTAGNGIDIDSNGVISKKNDAPVPLFALLAYILTGTETGMYN